MSSTARTKSRREDQLDAVIHAIGDRTRRALLARLSQRPALVTELAKPFAMTLPAVSKHIRVLERAGLIVRTINGRAHQCSIDPTPLTSVVGWLEHYRQFWEGQLESLAKYVERPDE